MSVTKISKDLRKNANKEKALILQSFFKTGKGQYGEGDIFFGLTVQQTRIIAKKYSNLKFDHLSKLLISKIHEERLCALLILVHNYENSTNKIERLKNFNFYLRKMKFINNWDLVDLSADKIVGKHLIDKDKSILYKLASSNNLWERRIAIVSTFNFIKNNQFNDTLKISKILINDKHDLIHKAVGWMLREIGKRNIEILEAFLKKNYKNMPRTMLRYAIERFPDEKRKAYLKGEI
ncbi:DNA alkylation repair protein [Candidatus Pacearchaeota archaeon]|nr:DNA alkylation repair protein [Candidatus Pacearchaeota archaeon]